MPQTARIEPTERSMPPVIMTVTWPSAMMAMKAKFRVTLKKFSSFQKALVKEGSISVIAIGIRNTAMVTQKACLAMSRCRIPGCGRGVALWLAMSMIRRSLVSRVSPSVLPLGGPDRAGDQARHLLRRALMDRLVGDLVAAAHDDDPVGDGEDVGHSVADEDDGDPLVAQPAQQVEDLRYLAHAD